MPEQARKLSYFTSAVVQEATNQTERTLRALEEKKEAALRAAEADARQEALRRIHAETARIHAKAGQEVSRHLMECKREIYLRREEIARQVFDDVSRRLLAFADSPEYFDALEDALVHAVGRLGPVDSVTVYLRPEDLPFSKALVQAVRPVTAQFQPGRFQLGGVIVDCPETGQRIDGSYDAALAELSGHFAELFGLSLSDELSEA